MIRTALWAIAGGAAVLALWSAAFHSPGNAAPESTAGASLQAAIGKGLFKRNWVPAPSSTRSNDGLGPLFNARSCVQCHSAATAGRLMLSDDGTLMERGAVVRLSTADGAPDPVYGAQLQTNAIPGHQPEAAVKIVWEHSTVRLGDGEDVDLRRPRIKLELFYGALAPGVSPSLLFAPSLGVAARIARADDAALATSTHDGYGRDRTRVFGRKGSERSLQDAVATAFQRDLGLSTLQHLASEGDCTAAQRTCIAGPHGADNGGVEIAPEIIAAVAAYVDAVPLASATNGIDGTGAKLFRTAGCEGCHRAEVPGKIGEAVTLFSDLRLHDLGEELSGVAGDGVPGRAWRTAPLLGISSRLAAGSTLLHDGRARSVAEAILWHGGEALAARDAFAALTAGERETLENYVSSR